MNSKKSLFALAAGAGLLVALAWWLTRDTGSELAPAEPLCPKLEGAKPAEVEITPPGAAPWRVERKGDAWRAASLAGYPAQEATFAPFVHRLSAAQCDVRKTALPANQAKLGLADTGEGAGTRVRIKDDKGAVLADVVLGHSAAEGGLFVRRRDEAQVWLSHDAPYPPRDATEWVNRQCASVPASGFKGVSLTAPMAQAVTLDAPPAETPSPAAAKPGEKPAGKKADAYPWKPDAVRRLLGALAWVQFDTVKKDGGPDQPQGLPTILRFLPVDPAQNETIEADLWPEGADQAWLRLRAVAPPMPPAPVHSALLAAAGKAQDKPKEPAPPPGIAAAKRKNEAWNGWLFKVGGDLGFAARQTEATLKKDVPSPPKAAEKAAGKK